MRNIGYLAQSASKPPARFNQLNESDENGPPTPVGRNTRKSTFLRTWPLLKYQEEARYQGTQSNNQNNQSTEF